KTKAVVPLSADGRATSVTDTSSGGGGGVTVAGGEKPEVFPFRSVTVVVMYQPTGIGLSKSARTGRKPALLVVSVCAPRNCSASPFPEAPRPELAKNSTWYAVSGVP